MQTKNSSPAINSQMAGHIKWLWENTNLNEAQISAMMGAIDQRRVSEVVDGRSFGEVLPQPVGAGNLSFKAEKSTRSITAQTHCIRDLKAKRTSSPRATGRVCPWTGREEKQKD